MKKSIFCLFLVVLLSCTENDKKLDRETNTYYANYKLIFDNQDSLSMEQTILLLDEYIHEYPNAVDAYKFKAYVYAKNDNFAQARTILQDLEIENIEKDEILDYLISLLLMNEKNLEEVEILLKNQKKDSAFLIQRSYNKFWLSLYQNDLDKAQNISQEIIKNDSLRNKRYAFTPMLIKAVQKDTSYLDSIKNRMPPSLILDKMDSLARDQINLTHYYKTLSN